MAEQVIYITDGESHCRIVDPTTGTIQASLKHISQQGALLETGHLIEAQAALDLTVVLKGLQPRQFFANVVTSDASGLQLQWMPIDSGEQARLKSLLEAYRTLHKPGPAPAGVVATHEKIATRRVIKPRSAAESSSAIMPFSDQPSAPTPANPGSSSSSISERVRTRRVVRPSQQNLPRVNDVVPFSDEPSRSEQAAKPSSIIPEISEDSGAQPVAVSTENTPSGSQAISDSSPGDGNPADGKTGIIGRDGKMDIGASIRSRAKSVRASDLAARHERVRVLNMGTIKTLIQEAVNEASHHLTRSLSETDRKRLLEEAEEGFKERLKALESEKLTSEARFKRLSEQLELAQKTLEEERKRTIKADQFTVSAAGLDEIEQKFKRLLDHSIAEGRVIPSLEEELRKVIATVFDQERQRIREQELKAQNEKISLLESKIKRLSGSLEETERQRDEMQEWVQLLESQGGGALRNVFTPGLRDGDPNKKRKLALMKEILDVNRDIRKALGIDTVPVDEATLEAIKKTEAESVLTAEEQAEILERRKRSETEPEARAAADAAAEMRNVIQENGGDPDAVSATTSEDPDEQPWEGTREKVRVTAGAVKVTADGTETLNEGAEIDPDDLPWEASSAGQIDDDDAGSIKKIKVETSFKMPPLERK